MVDQFNDAINENFNDELDLLIEHNKEDGNDLHCLVDRLKKEILRLKRKESMQVKILNVRIVFLEKTIRDQIKTIRKLETIDLKKLKRSEMTKRQIETLDRVAFRQKMIDKKDHIKKAKRKYYLEVLVPKKEKLNAHRNKIHNRKIKRKSSKGKEEITELEES